MRVDLAKAGEQRQEAVDQFEAIGHAHRAVREAMDRLWKEVLGLEKHGLRGTLYLDGQVVAERSEFYLNVEPKRVGS